LTISLARSSLAGSLSASGTLAVVLATAPIRSGRTPARRPTSFSTGGVVSSSPMR
jgi:hypothetical protein